jgi:uncharacterized protein (TIGR00369 family)
MNEFEPKDPKFRNRVKSSFDRQQCMTTLGIAISRIEPGMVELTMPYAEPYTQQHGFIHAGIISTAMDSACGYAAFSLMSAEAAVLTVEYKINFLAPARGEDFIFRAEVVKPGRTLTLCDAHAYAITAGSEKMIATMSGTMMALFDREGIQQ